VKTAGCSRSGGPRRDVGYPARVAPLWTEEKLRVLDCYMRGFAQACKGHPLGWYALDIFAGVGLNISKTTGAEIPGSALIALQAKSPFAQRVMLCEYSPRIILALTARILPYGDRARVFVGDANARIGEMLAPLPQTAPTFAFLDPEGSELAWTTVEAIARHKEGRSQYRVEQLILLPTDMGFVRMLPISGEPDEASAEKLTRMYGHDRWRKIYQRRRSGKITPDQARTEYVELYAQGLRDLGYAPDSAATGARTPSARTSTPASSRTDGAVPTSIGRLRATTSLAPKPPVPVAAS